MVFDFILEKPGLKIPNSYIPIIQPILKMCTAFFSLPIKYTKAVDIGEIHRPKIKTTRIFHLFGLSILILHVVLCFTRIFQFRFRSTSSIPMWKLVLEVFALGIYSSIILMQVSVMVKIDDVIHLINSTMKFEQNCIREGMSKYVDHILVLVYAASAFSLVFIPICISLGSFIKPCLPSFIGASLPICTNQDSKESYHLIVYITAALIEGWSWWILCSIVIFSQLVAVTYPASVMKLSIHQINRFKKDTKLEKIALRYRLTQCHSAFLNDCFKSTIVPLMTFAWIYAEVLSLFVIIRLSDQVPYIMIAFFSSIASDGYLFIQIVINSFSDPFLASGNLLRKWKSWSHSNKKWFHKFVVSCSLIKVKMGSVNFVDQMTGLTIWQFCVDNTISLLLATR